MTVPPVDVHMDTRPQLLRVSFDLDETPELARVITTLRAFPGLWSYTVLAEGGRSYERWRGPLEERRAADIHPLVVRSISLGSPLEAILTASSAGTYPVYVVTSIVALRSLLKTVMEWQQHREDLADRRIARERARGGLRVPGAAGGVDPEATAILEQWEQDRPNPVRLPFLEREVAQEAITTLMNEPIIGVDLEES